MIFSHRHRFIFFAVPKTATHAFRQALTPQLGPHDWQQQVLFGKQFSPIPDIAAIKHGHISVRQLAAHVPEDIWNAYLKFGFVRNPFDRFVSTCFFLNRNNPAFADNAVQFMKRALTIPRFQQRILVRPQSELLAGEDGEVGVDVVGRYEDLQASFDTICVRIGIPPTALPVKNQSEHDSYRDYYDDELRSLVAGFYARDFEMFGYEPGGA